MNGPGFYFAQYYSLLRPFVDREEVTDIYVNQPEEVWIETLGGKLERADVPGLNEEVLSRLSRQVAAYSDQGINQEHPLLSAKLPDGARIQVVLPPATRRHVALAIRKHVVSALSLKDYHESGAFADTSITKKVDDNAGLHNLAIKRDFATLLSRAILARKNILVAGGTSTGKTTFLNALLNEVPLDERLIIIEDAPELRLQHPNSIGFVAARSALGLAIVTMEDLLNASLRMRPDRIILGELRGPEAFTFLRALNTGHSGSITTVHADSPERAIEQIALLVIQSGTTLDHQTITNYVRSSIDVFVQLERVAGRRIVSEVRVRN